MTPSEFLRRLEVDWGRRFDQDTIDDVLEIAHRYSAAELETVRQHLLQMPSETYFRPQVIVAAARECGVYSKRWEDRPRAKGLAINETNPPYDCDACEDIGLRFRRVCPELDEDRRVRKRTVGYLPKSKAGTTTDPDEYLILSRCTCDRGRQRSNYAWSRPTYIEDGGEVR